MLLAAGAVAALAAGGAAPCPTNAPKHPGTAASCAAFCSGQCSYHPDYAPMKPTNLTAYRLTAAKMLKYGIGNKDTGDAAGDVGFYMSRFMSLVNCAPPWTAHGCFLDELPVIQEFVLETDGVWGPYLKCNPLTAPNPSDPERPGVPILDEPFLCNYGNSGPPQPVDPEGSWGKGGCGCARANRTVGVDPAHHTMPADCKPDPTTGKQKTSNIGCMFGGWWYSTPSAGECAPGAKLGTDGCTWRTISQPKTVNDTGCMAARMVAPLKSHNKACFDKLPPPAAPATPGFGDCFYGALFGDTGLEPIAPALLVEAWEKAFSSDDPAEGGCPNIKGEALVG